MNKICEKCKEPFSSRVKMDGVFRNLQNRKYCLKCSPFGKHNTRKLTKHATGFRICCTCKKKLPKKDFYPRRKDSFNSQCKKCLHDYQLERWKRLKEKAVDYKGGKCYKCGYNTCMNSLCFHHRFDEEKDVTWNKLRLRSWSKITLELDKCDLVCANCHGEIHAAVYAETE